MIPGGGVCEWGGQSNWETIEKGVQIVNTSCLRGFVAGLEALLGRSSGESVNDLDAFRHSF